MIESTCFKCGAAVIHGRLDGDDVRVFDAKPAKVYELRSRAGFRREAEAESVSGKYHLIHRCRPVAEGVRTT